MRLDHAEDLAQFVDELKRETDRGLPLVAAALLDEKLLETLSAFFCMGKSAERLLTESNAPLGTFSSRIEACFALGLIDEHEQQEITLIRKVRNEFAHAKHGLSFCSEKIKGLCSSLNSDLPQGSNYPITEARFRFINAVVCMALRLYYRPDWVAKERRVAKSWVASDATKWRSFEEEKPPEGMPVMVIGKRTNQEESQ